LHFGGKGEMRQPRKKRRVKKEKYEELFDEDEETMESNNNNGDVNEVLSEASNETEENLKSFILKRIIKENHNSEIYHMQFNRVSKKARNLLATLSHHQVSKSTL
jgi:hypothetical protein